MFSFKNIGNSCYLNSALQCLMRLPALNEVLDIPPAYVSKNETPAQVFFKEYDDLRRMALDNENCTISPALFRHAVQLYAKHKKNSDFAGSNQNDAAEFIQFLLHGIHEALARKEDFDSVPVDNDLEKKCLEMMKLNFSKEFSDIVHLFYGIQLSYIQENVTPEAFLTLNLPIPPAAKTLLECFQAYFADETIDGWQNEKTGKEETVTKTLRLFRLPSVLFLCLKRFSANGRKNDQYIEIPTQFEINNDMFVLQCGCYHQGNLNSGHYTATVNISGKWVVVDDDASFPATNLSKNAYCLFYVRKGLE